MDWGKRAKNLRTKKAEQAYTEQECNRQLGKHELSKVEYWKQFVKTQDDVVKYYTLYYPEYPAELVTALAARLEALRQAGRAAIDEKYVKKHADDHVPSHKWDYQAEVKAEKIKGQMALADKHMQELLLDEEARK